MKKTLRPHQMACIKDLYQTLRANIRRPLAVMPTGSGKSLIVAHMARDCLSKGKRAMCVVPRRKLVAQNANEYIDYCDDTPGIYCAGLGLREVDRPFTIGTIHSLHRQAHQFKGTRLLILDEAHLIKGSDDGMWRSFIGQMSELNPGLMIVGLTATPGRLDQGHLTDGENPLFSTVAHETTITELVEAGYCAALVSKEPESQIDLTNVSIRGGEYVQGELETAAMEVTERAIAEAMVLAGGRKKWMVFASGITHAKLCADILRANGISACEIHHQIQHREQDAIMAQYRAGEIKCIVGCEILTTGFDEPTIDCIIWLRSTRSASLFVQGSGRGTRISEGKEDCLLLDYGGNLYLHGPIDQITEWGKKKRSSARKDIKTCKACRAINPSNAAECKECGAEFPKKPRKLAQLEFEASQDQVLGGQEKTINVLHMSFDRHFSQNSGNESFRIDYWYNINKSPTSEWLNFGHEKKFPRRKANDRWVQLGGRVPCPTSVAEAFERAGELQQPETIHLTREGRYWRVHA